jgi:hypothetical protein
VYLHYVFDLWAEQWRKRHAQGAMIIVRYADDIVCGFAYEHREWAAACEQRPSTGIARGRI